MASLFLLKQPANPVTVQHCSTIGACYKTDVEVLCLCFLTSILHFNTVKNEQCWTTHMRVFHKLCNIWKWPMLYMQSERGCEPVVYTLYMNVLQLD